MLKTIDIETKTYDVSCFALIQKQLVCRYLKLFNTAYIIIKNLPCEVKCPKYLD